MATDDRHDPYRAYHFVLEIDNIPRGAFTEVSGLTAEGDSVDYREGSDVQPSVRKLVGLRKYTNLMLKRGYSQDKSLWQWYTNILNGIPDRRNVAIVLLNEQREIVLRWNAENAWINKIEGPAMNATSNDVAMESIELCQEALPLEA